MAIVGLLGACSTSASETPWPVEPVDAITDPRGEDLVTDNVVDTSKLPDNYNKDAGAASAKPTPKKSDDDDGARPERARKPGQKKADDTPAPF